MADVYDRTELAGLIERAAPDAVMHQLTDLSTVDLAANARLRTVGTRNLADAAHTAGVQRFVAQSIAWAYVGGEQPAKEDEPLDLSAPEPRRTTVRAVDALETAVRAFSQGVVLRYGSRMNEPTRPKTPVKPGLGVSGLPGDLNAADLHVSVRTRYFSRRRHEASWT